MKKKGFIGLGIVLILIVVYIFLINPYQSAGYKIDGYTIYQKSQGRCKAYYEIIIYEDLDDTYYVSYSGCNEDDYLYIFKDFKFISLKDAIEEEMIDPALLKGRLRIKE